MAKTNDQIKQEILDNITPNGNQEITGPILKSVLDDMQDFSNENVSVSQNTQTGHTDINIGGVANSVASVEDVERLDLKLIKLVGIAGDAAAAGVTKQGDIFYNVSSKKLRMCISWTGEALTSTFVTVPFFDGAIYTYSNKFYVWNGEDLEMETSVSVQGNKLLIGGSEARELSPSAFNTDSSGLITPLAAVLDLKLMQNSGVGAGLNNGEYGYNTGENRLYYKKEGIIHYITPNTNGLYRFNGVYYKWNGTSLIEDINLAKYALATEIDRVEKLGSINLKVFAGSGVAPSLSNGEYGYNLIENKIYHKDDNGNVLKYTPTVNGLYFYNGLYYRYNGTKLVENLSPKVANANFLGSDLTQGYYIPVNINNPFDENNRITSAGNAYIIIPVKSGMVFNIKVVGGNGARAWAKADINKIVREVSNASITYEGDLSCTYDGYLILQTYVANLDDFHAYLRTSLFNSIADNAHRISNLDSLQKGEFNLPVYLVNNPCSVLLRGQGMMSIIHSWGIIGASYDSGEFEFRDNGVTKRVDDYKYSWGQIMARMNGITDIYNFSNGGQTAQGWIHGYNNVYSQEGVETWVNETVGGVGLGGGNWQKAKLSDMKKQAYIIVLGSNDVSESYPVGDLSTDIGVYDSATDTDTNAATYAGYMAGIIQRLQSIQPDAKLFVATIRNHMWRVQRWVNMNSIIRGLPSFFSNVYILDMAQYGPNFNDIEWGTQYELGGHPNPAGYTLMAYYYNTLIDWVIRRNITDFANSVWIGTNRTTLFNITNQLSNVSTNNPNTSIDVNDRYTAILSPIEGMTLTSLKVYSKAYGENEITSEVVSGNVIDIPHVMGDIRIVASAEEIPN